MQNRFAVRTRDGWNFVAATSAADAGLTVERLQGVTALESKPVANAKQFQALANGARETGRERAKNAQLAKIRAQFGETRSGNVKHTATQTWRRNTPPSR